MSSEHGKILFTADNDPKRYTKVLWELRQRELDILSKLVTSAYGDEVGACSVDQEREIA
jgi:hypothetical protein